MSNAMWNIFVQCPLPLGNDPPVCQRLWGPCPGAGEEALQRWPVWKEARGCPVLDIAGSSQLQYPHCRIQLSPKYCFASKLALIAIQKHPAQFKKKINKKSNFNTQIPQKHKIPLPPASCSILPISLLNMQYKICTQKKYTDL